MKKVILLSGLGCCMLVMANCAKKTTGALTNKTTTTEVVTASTYSTAQLNEGKTIWLANCTKCHDLIQPAARPRAKWERVLPVMIKKAKLAEDKGALVYAYIMSEVKD